MAGSTTNAAYGNNTVSNKTKNKKHRHFYDYSLMFTIIFINAFGLIMIYSASSYVAQMKNDNAAYYMIRQGVFVLIGFVVMMIISFIDYHFIIKFALPLYIVSFILMIMVSLVGKEVNGKKRWLGVGTLSFQPTEIAKIALIIFLAVFITNMGKQINTWKGLFMVAGIDALLFFPVAANNLSSGIIIFGIAFVVSFVATNKKWIYLGITALMVLMLEFVGPMSKALESMGILKTYQLSRILVWMDPSAFPQEGGYQVLQGLYAIGSGGLVGKGLGESIQKLGFVPEAQNDYIFSIICEELGLFGAVSIILIFVFMIYRCLIIANSAPDMYGSLIVVGVMSHIAIQVILNIAVVTNSIPNTGITLPFISYGGTAVVFLMAEMGLVLSVSRRIRLEY